MKLHELPYFKALLEDRSRFVRLLLSLNKKDHSAAEDAVRALLRFRDSYRSNSGEEVLRAVEGLVGAMNEVCARLTTECEEGNCPHMTLVYRIKVNSRYFSHQNLDRLRRFMSIVDDAEDAEELKDLMIDELELSYCDGCDEWEYSHLMTETYGNGDRCRSCINEDYQFSSYYDSYVHNEDARDALDEEGESVVISRHDSDFRYSDRQHTWVHFDYEEEQPSVIDTYHSSKRRQLVQHDDWTRANKRALGVELEIEVVNGAMPEDIASTLNDHINGGDVGNKVFFERDGSLSNGFEIISQPMSLPAQRKLWEWLNNKSLLKNMRSHQTTTCGLHVHVSRSEMTALQIGKIVTFVNNPYNEGFIRTLARRYAEGFCRIKQKKVGTATQSDDRYEAVNVTPSKTIEFRLFKGSLKYQSVISAIEFVNALVAYTRTCGECSASDLKHEPFMEFVNKKMASECKTFIAYMTNKMEVA